MSKDDFNFLKTQTCVLKVNIHCDGCKKKVKKLLQKIDGVYTTTIDADHGRVTVTGNVDPATLVKKLCKAGKHAELLAPKGGGGGGGNQNLGNQFQKLQLDGGKGQQKDNGKPAKGGGGKDQKGGGGGQQQQQQLLQQFKGFKDMKLPQLKDLKLPFQKDQKNVKFNLPPEDMDDGSEFDDDEFDDDDFDDDGEFDDDDEFGEDFYNDPKNSKMKPMELPPNIAALLNDKKGGGAGGGGAGAKKGGGGGEIPVQFKGMMGVNNGNGGGGKNGGGGGGGKNGGGGGAHDSKNGGGGNKGVPNGNGHGGANNNGHPANGGKKGGGKNDGGGGGGLPPMGNPMIMMGHGHGMNPAQMGAMQAAMGHHMGGLPAVQGLPASGPRPGYFQGPPPAATANPYQQQYMAAMMQQRAAMMNAGAGGYDAAGAYPPMSYSRPPMQAPPGEPIGNYFSDENANGCSIM